jgi:hypothetical protein
VSPVIGFQRGLSGHPEGLPEFAYGWLEAPLAAKLIRLQGSEWKDLEAWPAGRIFGEEGEYRWQRNADGTVHAVLLLETLPLPTEFDSPLVLEKEEDEDGAFVLWGEWVDPKGDPEGNPGGGPRFYAQEIPEIQDYPLDSGETLKPGVTPRLLVRRYRDVEGRHGEFIRCVGLSLTAQEERGDG